MKLRKTLCSLLLLAGLSGCATTDVPIAEPTRDPTRSAIAVTNTRLGVGYLGEGKYDIAFEKLTKALYADDNFAPAHGAMALLQDRLGEPDKAREHFRRALALDPNQPKTLNNFAGFLCRNGEVERAEKMFIRAAENRHYATPEFAYTNAGLCNLNTGNIDSAETFLRKALSINPKIGQALMGMARVSFAKQRHLSARAYLERYSAVARHTPRSLWLAVRVERTLGDAPSARGYGRLLRTQFPDSAETQLYLESQNK